MSPSSRVIVKGSEVVFKAHASSVDQKAQVCDIIDLQLWRVVSECRG